MTTGQIYWGAVPFVIIQVIMVGAHHRLPADDHALQGQRAAVDPSMIQITLPPLGGGQPGGDLQLPSAPGLPGLGLPPATGGGGEAEPAAPDGAGAPVQPQPPPGSTSRSRRSSSSRPAPATMALDPASMGNVAPLGGPVLDGLRLGS